MPPRNLLICFDAFGTLFKPRRPIAQQYGEVARSLSYMGFSDQDVEGSFKAAFKQEAKQHPNFGKESGMNAEQWWTNIIRNTFQPLVDTGGKQLHRDLVPKLLHRFWCNEGYDLATDFVPLLQMLRKGHQTDGTQIVVGVITNSDDRVPDVLSSFGLRVNPLRYGGVPVPSSKDGQEYDIDFSVMSYDVGHEKPDKRIFFAAEEMLEATLEARCDVEQASFDPRQWQKVYIGDEYDKDVVGAVNAGWNAVLIGPRNSTYDDVEWLYGDLGIGGWSEMFQDSKAVGFESFRRLMIWL